MYNVLKTKEEEIVLHNVFQEASIILIPENRDGPNKTK